MKINSHSSIVASILLTLSLLSFASATARAQGTAFTYQGQLQNGGAPANGIYDFQIKLFTDALGVSQTGSALATNAVPVSNGVFTVSLDFGAGVFNGSAYWLQIGVRSNNVGSFTALAPLQEITPTPYALFAESGGAAQSLASGVAMGSGDANNLEGGNLDSFIGGGQANSILTQSAWSTISGGSSNTVESFSSDSTIGGGGNNSVVGGIFLTIGGGESNVVAGYASVISGGLDNHASGSQATVAGGMNNTALSFAMVGGGQNNQATNLYAFVGSGFENIAGGYASTVSGGLENQATGQYATVPGGFLNFATGIGSLAAGGRAQAMHDGSFVWADSQPTFFTSTGNDQFLIRAQGGVGVNVANPNGASLAVQGSGAVIASFANANSVVVQITNDGTIYSKGLALTSDRNAKENFTALDHNTILAKIAALPVTEWNYKNDAPAKKHIGPVAQDFQSAFGLNGADNTHISVVDEGGVALAAIQALNQKLNEKDAEIAQLKQRLDKLEQLAHRQ